MYEADDRLAGDLVWELFPAQEMPGRLYLWMAILVIETWVLYPPLSVFLACLAVAFQDFQKGHRLAKTIPDKAGGRICSLFTYAWGMLKFSVAAFVLMFATLFLAGVRGQLEAREPAPPEIPTAMFLWVTGFLGTSILTASGLVKAFRSEMRVWIGEGINQARTLLLAMLILAFSIVVIGPICIWLIGWPVPSAGQRPHVLYISTSLIGFWVFILGGPVGILTVLDWMSRRVVAKTPGKFGAKVPAVGKWNS